MTENQIKGFENEINIIKKSLITINNEYSHLLEELELKKYEPFTEKVFELIKEISKIK